MNSINFNDSPSCLDDNHIFMEQRFYLNKRNKEKVYIGLEPTITGKFKPIIRFVDKFEKQITFTREQAAYVYVDLVYQLGLHTQDPYQIDIFEEWEKIPEFEYAGISIAEIEQTPYSIFRFCITHNNDEISITGEAAEKYVKIFPLIKIISDGLDAEIAKKCFNEIVDFASRYFTLQSAEDDQLEKLDEFLIKHYIIDESKTAYERECVYKYMLGSDIISHFQDFFKHMLKTKSTENKNNDTAMDWAGLDQINLSD